MKAKYARCWLVAVVLFGFSAHGQSGALETSDALLLAGRYSEIPRGEGAHALALWAFARYHLAPDQEVFQAAQQAHEAGDRLGTYVLLQSVENGVGCLRDEGEVSRLREGLLKELEAIAEATALDSYMHSKFGPRGLLFGKEPNIVVLPDGAPENFLEERNRAEEQAFERLVKSAELGFAQAIAEIARTRHSHPALALQWYERAADRGLAEGLRYAGFILVQGFAGDRDLKRGFDYTRRAADRGDVYAMINLVVFHHQGTGVAQDQKMVEYWLDWAAESGHWYGCIEKGAALMGGHYGLKADPAEGLKSLQKAVDTGQGAPLAHVGSFYKDGWWVRKDGPLAVKFALAAYRQGSEQGAQLLEEIYGKGVGSLEPDEGRQFFWRWEAVERGQGLKLRGAEGEEYLRASLATIDPRALKVE